MLIGAMLSVSTNISAQTLSVQDVEVQTGKQSDLVVSLTGGISATALQFNLKLPEGVTLNANSATLGVATDGHTSVWKLSLMVICSSSFTAWT